MFIILVSLNMQTKRTAGRHYTQAGKDLLARLNVNEKSSPY